MSLAHKVDVERAKRLRNATEMRKIDNDDGRFDVADFFLWKRRQRVAELFAKCFVCKEKSLKARLFERESIGPSSSSSEYRL